MRRSIAATRRSIPPSRRFTADDHVLFPEGPDPLRRPFLHQRACLSLVHNPDQKVLGKTMREQMRFAVAYWHTLCWPGTDLSAATRSSASGHHLGDEMAAARMKADIMFETLSLLDVDFFCFHDLDIAPEGQVAEGVQRQRHGDRQDLREEDGGRKQEAAVGNRQHVLQPPLHGGGGHQSRPRRLRLLRGQVKHCLDVTKDLDGANYVMWAAARGLRDAAQHQYRP